MNQLMDAVISATVKLISDGPTVTNIPWIRYLAMWVTLKRIQTHAVSVEEAWFIAEGFYDTFPNSQSEYTMDQLVDYVDHMDEEIYVDGCVDDDDDHNRYLDKLFNFE